jgi:hypothetical protein
LIVAFLKYFLNRQMQTAFLIELGSNPLFKTEHITMANSRDPVNPWTYFDDTNTGWRVDLTDSVKNAGGFASSGAGLPYLPKHAKMRHVGLYDSGSKKRNKCPQSTSATGAYSSGGSLSLDGVNFRVTGRIGEKFRL